MFGVETDGSALDTIAPVHRISRLMYLCHSTAEEAVFGTRRKPDERRLRRGSLPALCALVRLLAGGSDRLNSD